MIIYGSFSCHIASRAPGKIGIKPIDKSVAHPTSIEFNDITTGWTFLRDRVRHGKRWEIYEDNTLIAEGEETEGRRLVSNKDSEIGSVSAIEFTRGDVVLTLTPRDGADVQGTACVLSLQTADGR